MSVVQIDPGGPGPDLPPDEAAAKAARVAARRAAAELLLTAPPPLDGLGPGEASDVRGEVLRPSRTRPVVRWSLSWTPAGGRPRPLTAIGKGYLRGGAAEQHRLLRGLRAAGLDGQVCVPEAYGHDPARLLLVQSEAPPLTLHDLLGTPQATPAAGLAGQWLARCHAVSADLVPPLPGDHVEERTDRQRDALRQVLDVPVPALDRLCRRALDAAATAPPVLTHGDYQPKNVHVGDDRVVVIDLDRAALAPAARDLGSFVVQTWTMTASSTGTGTAAAAALQAFRRGYEAHAPRSSVVDLGPHVAVALLEVLYYRLVVRPVPQPRPCLGWLDELEGWWAA